MLHRQGGPSTGESSEIGSPGHIWTDGSRLGSGRVGAACAWKTRESWAGRCLHLGDNKEVFELTRRPSLFTKRSGSLTFDRRPARSTRSFRTPSQRSGASRPTFWVQASSGQEGRRRCAGALWPVESWPTESRLTGVLPATRRQTIWPSRWQRGPSVISPRFPTRSGGRSAFPPLYRRATGRRSRETAQWATAHVGPERHRIPLEGRVSAAGRNVRPGGLWPADITSYCPGMPRSAPPFTSV